MIKICSICGQSIEENVVTCPFCNNSLHGQNNEETPQPNTEISEEKLTKTSIEESEIPNNQLQAVAEISNKEIALSQTESESIAPSDDNQSTSSSPIEISDTVIETNNLNDESINTFEEIIVDNVNLETVAVDKTDITLEVEEQKIQMPEIPEATIGEINPDLLGNFYAQSEKENNEKRVLKQQQEAEQERIRQEEALKNASIPVVRPDLLAGVNLNGEQLPQQIPVQKKPKKGKSLKLIIVLLIIIILLVVLWFFVLKDTI